VVPIVTGKELGVGMSTCVNALVWVLLSAAAEAALDLKISPGTWSWIGGPSALDGNGGADTTAGVKFFSSPSVVPNGVRGACSALDETHNVIFIYGGCRPDCCATYKDMLWVFNITSAHWAWVSGGSTDLTGTVPHYGTLNVAYPVTTSMQISNPGERVHCAAASLSDGTFYLYSGRGVGATGAGNSIQHL
jgi:hypothetical protein